MGPKNESIKPRMLWLGRFTAKSSLLLGVFIGIAVFAARVPNQYVCLQVLNGYGISGRQFDLVDLQSGNDMLDTRTGQSAFGIPSPDGNYSAALQVDKSGAASSLVIKSTDSAKIQMSPVVVQSGMVDTTSGYYRLGSLQWANDSSRLAYLWTGSDQQMHLSVVRANGSDKVTIPYSEVASGNGNTTPNLQINWSADNTYFSIGEASGSAGIRYTLWSAADLQRADADKQIIFRAGVWSPKAHQFAAIQEDQAGSQTFTLWSSPTEEVRVAMNATPGKLLDQILWSPDGQYLALQSHRPCDALESCSERLSYDILSSTGQPITSNMNGEASSTGSSSASTQSPYRTFYYYNSSMPVVAWAADSTSLVFLEENPAENVADLIAYHIPSGQSEVIAHNVVGDMAQEMMSTAASSFFRRRGFGRSTTPLTSTRLVLPTWNDNNKINVELSDLDGGHRVTLVQDADEILNARSTLDGYGSRFWVSNGQTVVVAWVTINPITKVREAHLTWANPDGSNKRQIEGFESINQMQVVQGKEQQRWLGYVAQKHGLFGIELADINTGAVHPVLDGFSNIEQWSLTPAPVGTQAAVQLGIGNGRQFSENTLYMVNLSNAQARKVSGDVSGLANWSPDGSRLAFLHHDSSSNTTQYAQVINAEGTTLQDVPVRNANSSYPRLFRWSQCS